MIEVTVDSESDDRGILGLDEAIPAGALSVRVAVVLGRAGSPEAPRSWTWVVHHCP